jgi:hypothetical protein
MEIGSTRKSDAIRYWEVRRIVWNLLLVPPALLSYLFDIEFAVGVDDHPAFGWPIVLAHFCFAALGANVCYSFAYVIEFWIQGSDRESGYHEHGRPLLFALGYLVEMGLSLLGGTAIAQLQFPI